MIIHLNGPKLGTHHTADDLNKRAFCSIFFYQEEKTHSMEKDVDQVNGLVVVDKAAKIFVA